MNNEKIGKKRACPCGSGKRYGKCCMHKKRRTTNLVFDMGHPVTVNSLRIDSGTITLMHNGEAIAPVHSMFTTQYQRSWKRKILHEIPSSHTASTINLFNALSGFDWIYAIDTNAKIIDGTRISVCSFCSYNPKTRIIDLFDSEVHFNNYLVSEKTNWRELVRYIRKQNGYSNSLSVAMIVDSDYGNISKFNSREIPIVGKFYLPQNFQLIYASTDSGMEYTPNKLIGICDKNAKRHLHDLEYLMKA